MQYCNRHFRLLVFIGLFLLTLSVSKVKSVPVDESILTQAYCAFPCWYGLVPGKTTLQEARNTLPHIDFAMRSEQGISEGAGAYTDPRYYVGWGNRMNEGGGSLAFENDILRRIIIYPNINFTLDDILTRYGLPDAWSMKHEVGSEVVYSYLTLNLYYVDYGLIIEVFIYEGGLTNLFTVSSDAKGLRFWLVPASGSFIQMLMDQWGYDRNGAFRHVNTDFKTIWPGMNVQIKDENPALEFLLKAYPPGMLPD